MLACVTAALVGGDAICLCHEPPWFGEPLFIYLQSLFVHVLFLSINLTFLWGSDFSGDI